MKIMIEGLVASGKSTIQKICKQLIKDSTIAI